MKTFLVGLLFCSQALGQLVLRPSTKYAADNILEQTNAAPILANLTAPLYVSTLADLASLGTNAPAHVIVLGLSGGVFERVAAATYPADGHLVVDGLGCQWARPLDGTLNAAWFGTVGDASTDDGPAIQLAVNAAALRNAKTILLPPGRYNIRTKVVVTNTAEGVTFLGTGTNSVIMAPSTVKPYPNLEQFTVGANTTFDNLLLDGGWDRITATNRGHYLISHAAGNLVIKNCLLKSSFDKLVYSFGGNVTIRYNTLMGTSYYDTGTFFYFSSPNEDVEICNNKFLDCGGWTWLVSLGANPSDGNTITVAGDVRTFRDSPTDPATEIAIGGSAALTAENVKLHFTEYPVAGCHVGPGVISAPAASIWFTFDTAGNAVSCNASSSTEQSNTGAQLLYCAYWNTMNIHDNAFIDCAVLATFRYHNGWFHHNRIVGGSKIDTTSYAGNYLNIVLDGYHSNPPHGNVIEDNVIENNQASQAFYFYNTKSNVIRNNIVRSSSDAMASPFAVFLGLDSSAIGNVIGPGNVVESANGTDIYQNAIYVKTTSCVSNYLVGPNLFSGFNTLLRMENPWSVGTAGMYLTGENTMVAKNTTTVGNSIYSTGMGVPVNGLPAGVIQVDPDHQGPVMLSQDSVINLTNLVTPVFSGDKRALTLASYESLGKLYQVVSTSLTTPNPATLTGLASQQTIYNADGTVTCTNRTTGTAVGAYVITNAVPGTEYTLSFWALSSNGVAQTANITSWTNWVWHTPRFMDNTLRKYVVSFVAGSTNSIIAAGDRDANSDSITLSNAQYCVGGYWPVNGPRVLPSPLDSTKAWRQVSLLPTLDSVDITAATAWLPIGQDTLVLVPDNNYVLTSTPLLLPSTNIGRIMRLTGANAYTVTLTDSGTLAGSLFVAKSPGTNAIVTTNTVVSVMWSGANWVQF